MFPIQNAVPSRYPPVVTWTLIAANCAVFFVEISLSPEELEWFLSSFALIPARYLAPLPYDDTRLEITIISPLSATCFCMEAGCI